MSVEKTHHPKIVDIEISSLNNYLECSYSSLQTSKKYDNKTFYQKITKEKIFKKVTLILVVEILLLFFKKPIVFKFWYIKMQNDIRFDVDLKRNVENTINKK